MGELPHHWQLILCAHVWTETRFAIETRVGSSCPTSSPSMQRACDLGRRLMAALD